MDDLSFVPPLKQLVAGLTKRAATMSARAARLEGMRELLGQQLEKLVGDVATAKGRAALTPEVSRVLETMQQRAVERSVGSFERVLSAILSDVLPEEGKVKLTPSLKYSSPGLDIEVDKGGNIEDVLDSNGGALTNVVSIGLRYSALSRTTLRKFMALDESECWLATDRVPALANVLSQVATKSGIQSMLITHHMVELFENAATVVRLKKDEKTGRISAGVVGHPLHDWSSLAQPGIRAIHLKNFGGHIDTVIPGFPGLTVYTGKNNLGKSMAVIQSLRAVAYGMFPENRIRHGQPQGSVSVTIENGQVIECTRYRNKSPAVVYRLFQAGDATPVRETKQKTRGEAPEWVQDLLGIKLARDIDIQLGSQKSPVFLLDDTSAKRAELLSIGREGEYLKDAMRRFEALKSQDRDFIKKGEQEAAALSEKINLIRGGELYLDILSSAAEGFESVSNDVEEELELESLLKELAATTTKLKDAALIEERLSRLVVPDAPSLYATKGLQEVVQTMSDASFVTSVFLPSLPPGAPKLEDTAGLMEVGAVLKSEPMLNYAKSRLLEVPTPPLTLEDIKAATDVKSIADAVEAQAVLISQQAKAFEDCQKNLSEEELALEQLKAKLKVCPLCGSGLTALSPHSH